LRFAHPQPSDERLAAYYASLYFDAADPLYDYSPPSYLKHVLAQLERQLGSVRGKRILDYGCGDGTLVRLMLESGAGRVDAFETDERARAQVHQELGVSVSADLAELQTGYDLITLVEVVEHLRSPAETLTPLARLLAPGGWLFTSTPNVDCLRARVRGARWENYANPTHLYYFNQRSLGRLLRQAGLHRTFRWQPAIAYPGQGLLGQVRQAALRRCGLEGSLRMLAQAPL
jgi:2-polyprenyl-3-methyl-5-hydroxy-6-metoxy-1,4-benzoquinol methylase